MSKFEATVLDGSKNSSLFSRETKEANVYPIVVVLVFF